MDFACMADESRKGIFLLKKGFSSNTCLRIKTMLLYRRLIETGSDSMQDRYAGDIGDFGKFGLLQSLCNEGFRIGINWYKTEPRQQELIRQDGRFLIPEKYSICNKSLCEVLRSISFSSNRSIKELEKAALLPDAVYYSDQVLVVNRTVWHKKAIEALSGTTLVFLDPDNGLLAQSIRRSSCQSVKYVFYEEVSDYLRNNQSVLIYSHRNRKKPSVYFGEIYNLLSSIVGQDEKSVQAITFPKGSVRDYFAISANSDHYEKIQSAFETLAYGIWGDAGICRLQPFPYQQCPFCENNRIKPILYGMPSHDAFELAEKGHFILGGCCVAENDPKWFCPKCGNKF